jgi:hypothetical protein
VIVLAGVAFTIAASTALGHVEQSGVIDAVAINAQKTEVLLALVQHLPWNERTKSLIERKVRTYIASVESGDLRRKYPQTEAMGVSIEVAYFDEPDLKALEDLERIEQQLKARGIVLRKRKLERSK